MREEFKGKKVTVVGLGREGTALVRFLVPCGAIVTVSDAKSAVQLRDSLAQIAHLAVRLSLDGNRIEDTIWADTIFVSPGVPKDLPCLEAARQRGIIISSESQLVLDSCPAPIIGVTGSAGKSTTTTLIGEMLKRAGKHVLVGGNLGYPIIDRMEQATEASWVVMELSSFQLETIKKSPPWAIITNIKPDHFDRHPSWEDYVAAKANIFKHQTIHHAVILNYDDPTTRAMAQDSPSPVWFFSLKGPVERGAFLHQGWLMVEDGGGEEALLPVRDVLVLGSHNLYNVLAASLVARLCGVETAAIRETVSTFKGLQHRLELVATIGGVAYYDDSIATTPERSIAAMKAFDRPVVLLAGGRTKNLPLDGLAQVVRDRCKGVVLFGEAGELLERALSQQGSVPTVRASHLEEAVSVAHQQAEDGDIVLLAPACTSYDEFANFEERGRRFKELVCRLRKD
ncbi:MAG: UDP-N-acetylmuramoyl-L-alanine--D-glutamate ligase [Chloroflexi bacterium]|nr:UDP-N-acetylmuramoyl-L-alanine--D-glutamate ligase [Chloroflexota bacterium]